MLPKLAYILHSGQLFGTERMALATLEALRGQFDGLLIAPPGPVHDAAHAAGLPSRLAQSRWAMLIILLRHLLKHPHSALMTTGVWQAIAGRWLQRLCGGRGAHLHMVHGGTDELLSYGRKRLLAGLQIQQVAVSDFVRQRLLAHGVPAARIQVIHNFLPPPVAAQGAPIRRARFEQDGLRRVLMLTRLDRIKRVGLLLDALDRTPELAGLRFDVYGSGEEAELLRQRARKHPNVHLHGFVADAAQALAAADLLLHTCPEEPFGLVLLEAFEAGVPVLVPNSGGAAEIVRHADNGWHFNANDAVALGQRLLQLSRVSAAELNRRASAGRRSLEQDFNPQRLLPRYVQLLRGAA
jgi:glycosyltransferase involved in cell wall biosynthesis